MASPPVIEWRASTTPFGVLSSLALSGTGFSGAIPAGTTSTAATVRVYNNFAAAASIADATSCVIAIYDDTVHQGSASTAATLGLYINVEVLDYNGSTTGQDTAYVALGGSTKHAVPVNGGVLGGAVANYVTVSIEAIIPSTATQGAVSQGIWLEYSSVA